MEQSFIPMHIAVAWGVFNKNPYLGELTRPRPLCVCVGGPLTYDAMPFTLTLSVLWGRHRSRGHANSYDGEEKVEKQKEGKSQGKALNSFSIGDSRSLFISANMEIWGVTLPVIWDQSSRTTKPSNHICKKLYQELKFNLRRDKCDLMHGDRRRMEWLRMRNNFLLGACWRSNYLKKIVVLLKMTLHMR